MSEPIITDHPLIQHKLTIMRDVRTGSKDFSGNQSAEQLRNLDSMYSGPCSHSLQLHSESASGSETQSVLRSHQTGRAGRETDRLERYTVHIGLNDIRSRSIACVIKQKDPVGVDCKDVSYAYDKHCDYRC